jgi:UDP-N-acetylmuramoyl-tripeptide--D-alanyl-D-alanine ligase
MSLEINELIFVGENFFKVNLHSKNAIKYNSFKSFITDSNLSQFKNAIILIKGSRGMALERTLEHFN